MKIDLAKLRKLAALHFWQLERLGYDQVEINRGYYWHIHAPDLYNPYEQPTELGLGDLDDEWAEMERILTGEFEPDPISLGWFAALLRAIADEPIPGRSGTHRGSNSNNDF